MRDIWLRISALALAVIILATVLPACQKALAADSYVAIVPDVLHSGRAEAVSLSLLSGGQFVKDNIEVTLLKDDKKVTSARQAVNGTGIVTLNIPQNAEEGKYEIQVCLGTACHVKGAQRVLEAFERELNIRDGETTSDQNFSLEADNQSAFITSTILETLSKLWW